MLPLHRRTYEWKGDHVLRCRHWDKVAIRWHISSCDESGRNCTGGSNVDYADRPQNSTEVPAWKNAFTYFQLPGAENGDILNLQIGGYDRRKIRTISIAPLKIDVDWRWQVDKRGCNNFVVRMSAMSIIDKRNSKNLRKFCKMFDKDQFVDCNNL
ncbi:unnamed protein product [Caenorhabditis bovis]|uniref:Uncharacterized protein n=1 Tax=Caenorhabditis bovis TaxID=2654633 RepID=A0A8S1EHF8_9PELO|nr:unnamed protein product [Caenorhabditis bovis]